MAVRVRAREITNDEGNRLLRTVRRSSGSVVTWRRAQMILLSAQGKDVTQIAQVSFTSPDRVRDVIHNFNADGFDSLQPRYAGGRPPKFSTDQREQVKQIALARPTDHGLPFSTWSLSKLADYLVAQGVVEDNSHEGLRMLLREQGVSFPGRQDLEDQREVLQVVRHDHLRACLDRCREHVAVVGVRQVEGVDQGLVARHEAVAHRAIHQFARPGQPLRIEVRPVRRELAEDLIEDPVGPLRLDQSRLSDADQQVSERARVQHVGVVENDERHLRAGPSLG
jgi:transposase